MARDSIHALWVDPLAFEPDENGPPYLPEKPRVKVASGADSVLTVVVDGLPAGPAVELAALVAILRAGALVHQSHHWQTNGPSYYGDHLLFERVYNESVGFIDQVAERAVGLGAEAFVGPTLQARLIPVITRMWCSDGGDPSEFVSLSLSVERCIVDCIETARAILRDRSELSSGTDNLLQGVADKHEEFIYLLQQRTHTDYSYDSR